MDAPSLQGSATDAPRPWGIIGAMDVEVQLLADAMEQVRTHAFGGCRCASGVLDGAPCVIAQCGVGMVHAAACTQMLIDRFDVRAVVNTGVAGSLRKDIHRKELVIATEALNWVIDVQNLGYAAGQTPGLDTPFLPTSDTINRQALAAARAEGVTAHCGRIASGDRFVRDAAEKERIAEEFDALCCEMEGAAIAQICAANDVPCSILRVISDNADGADEEDYPTFEKAAARTCAAITRRMIRLLFA